MYFKLLKVFFKENFSLRRMLGTDIKGHKGKAILIGLLVIYGLASVLFSFGFIFFKLGDALNQFGLIDILLIYGFIYATTLATMFVIFRANGYLFNYKDYEILEPLPLKTNTVIFAKLTVMMVFIYLSVYVFLIPIIFTYFHFGGFNLLSLIILIIGSLTIPIIPLIVFSFVSLLIARITSKFRKNNFINLILLFIVFLVIMYLSISINSVANVNPLLNQQDFMKNLSKYYPPIKWFVEAVSNHNFIDLLLLILTNTLFFVGFVYAIQELVISTNQRGLTKITRKNNRVIKIKKRSLINAIAVKESRKFFNTPIYALNVGFGPIIMIISAIASLFYSDKIKIYLNGIIGLGISLEQIILILIGFSLSMVYSSALSLSLEGKNFWIIKSLPIKSKTIMHGKMLFNVLLGLPIALISLLLFSYSLDITFLRLFIMIIFVTSLSFVITVLGSIVNLFVPKFEFHNPAEVVKQSASALLGLFGTWILLAMNGVIFYFLTKSLSFEVGLILISALNYFIFTGLLVFINKKSESLFMKFEV